MGSRGSLRGLLYDDRDDRYITWNEEVAPGIYGAVILHEDWRLRARYIQEEVHDFEHFLRTLLSRARFFMMDFPIAEVLDVGYARSRDECFYASRVATNLSDYPFQSATTVHRNMLMFEPGQLGIDVTGRVASHHDVHRRRDVCYIPDRKLREFERRFRHRTECFIGYHCTDATALNPGLTHRRYPALPSWWIDYEVPFRLWVQTPPILTYWGLIFMSPNHGRGWDLMLRTEWAALCCIELIHEARNGRLWWLPNAVIEDIRQLETGSILHGASGDEIRDLDNLLLEVRCIRWDRVPITNRFLPRDNSRFTPVYNNGEFVEWDVTNWRTNLSEDTYLPLDPYEQPMGFVDRGVRQQGSNINQPSHVTPQGRQPGLDEFGREPGYSISERYGASQREYSIAQRVVRNAAEQLGMFTMLRDLGHQGRWTLTFFMEEFQSLLREKTESLRRNTNPASQQIENADQGQEVLPGGHVNSGGFMNVSLPHQDNHEEAVALRSPRVETPAESSSGHAQLAYESNITVAGNIGQRNNFSSMGSLPAASSVLGETPVSLRTPLHALTQSYFNLVREGIVNPDEYRPENPNYGNLQSMIWMRAFGSMPTGFNNNNSSDNQVEVRELTAPDTEIIDLDGAAEAPSNQQDPVTLANEGVSEAQASVGARSHEDER